MPHPTIDDITKVVCPDIEPYKCLPYGGCYGPGSYCHKDSHTVESCFPPNLTSNDSKLAYCQDVSQNISQLLDRTCGYACMTLRPERPDVSAVLESCADVWIRFYVAVAVIIFLAVTIVVAGMIICLCMHCRSCKKKIFQTATFKYQDARADGYALTAVGEEAENTDMLVHMRNLGGSVVPPDTDVDVSEVTQPQSQNQHQQPNQTQQPLENTNGSPQLQQPFLTNSVDEVPQSCPSSGNDSAMSSPESLSPSASSVSTDDDSGLSSGRGSRIDHANLVQQTSQTHVLTNQNGDFNQQSNGEHRANRIFYANASIPDGESAVVTSLSPYRD